MLLRRRTEERRRRGAATVELAIVVPVLAALMMGMFEIARGIMVKSALDDAAWCGCRIGAKPGRGATLPIQTAADPTITNMMADIIEVMRDNNLNPVHASYSISVMSASGVVSTNTYAVSGTAGNYIVTRTSGSDAGDPLWAVPGQRISVTISMPVAHTMWMTGYFLSPARITSESMTMVKHN
jgi:Flp pilus assembly protein TadG